MHNRKQDSMATFAEKVIEFNRQLNFTGILPDGIQTLNPFRENKDIMPISKAFYKKFYDDNNNRILIIGINPGRLGAGVTGIPFTDTKRLKDICKININSVNTHEPSSVFIYDMIEKYGGPEKFYSRYYITSFCPLGFVIKNPRGNWVNCNYYDYELLYTAMKPFILNSLKQQVNFGADTTKCYVLGKKNAKYVSRLNDQEKLFESVVVLEHPRYIQQYKSKFKEQYISGYLDKLR